MAESKQANTAETKVEYDELGFVKDYVCPACGGKLRLDHEDDIGTKWFACEKCGQQSAKPKSAARIRLEEELKDRCGDCKFFRTILCQFGVDVHVKDAVEYHGCQSFKPRLGNEIATCINSGKESQTTRLAEYALEENIRFFTDQHGTAYAVVFNYDNSMDVIPPRSRKLKGWLSNLMFERELVQQLDHHRCAFYDNLTRLPTWISDAMCRAATGTGFSKRELYTDDDDIIYNFKRCVGLSGINIAAVRSDLLDRSLLIGLKIISNQKRREERELFAKFEKCKSEILGAFLDALAKAIEVYPTLNLKGLFRMADFTRWGCAISVALGKTPQDFLGAYRRKVALAVEEAAHSSTTATVLIDWMQLEKKGGLLPRKITPTKLYKTLRKHAKEELGINTNTKGFPKTPNVLTRQINELAPSLKELGWNVTSQRTATNRYIMIKTVTTVTPSQHNENRAIINDDTKKPSLISSYLPSKKASAKDIGKPLDDGCDDNDGFSPSSELVTRICWICNNPMPLDLYDCTAVDGKNVHLECYRRLKTGRRDHTIMGLHCKETT